MKNKNSGREKNKYIRIHKYQSEEKNKQINE